MKKIFTLCLFFSLCTSHAQDTLYLNNSYEEVARDSATYFQIDHRNPSDEDNITRRTFWLNGQIKSERNFLEKGKELTDHGMSKFWYENGEFYYSQNYRKGKRHGELLAYWENGTKRRQDFFKKGKLKSGQVWNKEGQKIEHFPVIVSAMFPGGQKAISAYLKKHLPANPTQFENTEVKIVVSILVNKEGYISKVKIIKGASHWYNAVTVNALVEMPRWNPGMHMGEPINVKYTLPVTFRK